MRKVVAGLFISLDGVVESPDQWQFDHFDAEIMASMGSQLGRQDAILLGRLTYQEWAEYWPTSTDEPFASFINNTPKFVVSTTLDDVRWNNSTLIKVSIADEIIKLKHQSGKDIGVAGSPTLVRFLLMNDLLDELTLMIHPVVVGRGKRFYTEESDLKRLMLVGSQITSTGVAILTYTSLPTGYVYQEKMAQAKEVIT
jgi:dihydrofolate reductase